METTLSLQSFFLLLLSCLTLPLDLCKGQHFMLRGVNYSDGATVLLSDIGEGENGLFCTTTQTDCCGVDVNGTIVRSDRRGDFYYPNENMVPIRADAGSDGLFRGRDYQSILLQRFPSATIDPPTGQYRCDIPDRFGVNHSISIYIGLQCGGDIVCLYDATCGNSNTCICPTGFRGDGRARSAGGSGCNDINECSTNTADCVSTASCVNTVGSFTCTCPTGFIGDGRVSGSGCIDKNECVGTQPVCDRNADCMNTFGNFTCTCRSGFTGNGKHDCSDINECSRGTDDCVSIASCSNTPGSFTCPCPSGFTGDGRASGNGCTDIDECIAGLHNCGDGFVCGNDMGSFRCIEIDECTLGIADCVSTASCFNSPPGSFTCTCPPGFTGDGRASPNGNGCIKEISIFITPSGTNTAGEQYSLTCSVLSHVQDEPSSFTWTGPPNSTLLLNDTRMVSDVMSSGASHSRILHFDPLQSSHEGIYTCTVTVGTLIEMSSIQVNVETAISVTSTMRNNETHAGTAQGGPEDALNWFHLLGLSVGLVVIVLSVIVAVNVIVCVVWKQKHSARIKSKFGGPAELTMFAQRACDPSSQELESEHKDVKTENETYVEIPSTSENFHFASNISYRPVQHSTTPTVMTLYNSSHVATPPAPNEDDEDYVNL